MKSLNKKKILQKNTYEINRHEIGYVFLWEYIHYDNVMHCFCRIKCMKWKNGYIIFVERR